MLTTCERNPASHDAPHGRTGPAGRAAPRLLAYPREFATATRAAQLTRTAARAMSQLMMRRDAARIGRGPAAREALAAGSSARFHPTLMSQCARRTRGAQQRTTRWTSWWPSRPCAVRPPRVRLTCVRGRPLQQGLQQRWAEAGDDADGIAPPLLCRCSASRIALSSGPPRFLGSGGMPYRRQNRTTAEGERGEKERPAGGASRCLQAITVSPMAHGQRCGGLRRHAAPRPSREAQRAIARTLQAPSRECICTTPARSSAAAA